MYSGTVFLTHSVHPPSPSMKKTIHS